MSLHRGGFAGDTESSFSLLEPAAGGLVYNPPGGRALGPGAAEGAHGPGGTLFACTQKDIQAVTPSLAEPQAAG